MAKNVASSKDPDKPMPRLTPPTDRDRTDDIPQSLLRKSAAAFIRESQNPERVFPPENVGVYAAAALTACLSRVGTKHPSQMTTGEMRDMCKAAFKIARMMDDEEEKQYSPQTVAKRTEK